MKKKLQAPFCELAEQSACEQGGVMAHFTALKEDASCRGTQRLFLSQTAASVCYYQPGMQTPNSIFQLFQVLLTFTPELTTVSEFGHKLGGNVFP